MNEQKPVQGGSHAERRSDSNAGLGYDPSLYPEGYIPSAREIESGAEMDEF